MAVNRRLCWTFLLLPHLLAVCVDSFITCPSCIQAGNVISCFESTQHCAGNQVCTGIMENFHISVDCGFEVECLGEVHFDKVNCTSGSPFQHDDRCHFCCHDLDSCRQTMSYVQKGIDGTHEVLHCPTCPEGTSDPYQCLSNLQPCDPGVKVCSIEWSGPKVKAGCEPNAVLCHLQESQSQFACIEEGLHEDAFCTRCCQNQACWLEAFYITTTTVTTTTTTPPPTTTTTTTTTPRPTTTTTPLPTTTPMLTTTTTPTATTTSLPTTTSPRPATTTTSASTQACINHIIYDYHCNSIPGICALPGAKACQHLCNLCTEDGSPQPEIQTPPQGQTCYDRVGNGVTCADLPGVCSEQVGSHILCPRYCGTCVTTTPVPACINHLIYDYHCNSIPGICALPGAKACQHLCNLCTDNGSPQPEIQTPPPGQTCYNRVGNGVTCAELPGVCSEQVGSHILCPRYCGTCVATTPVPACINHIIYDYHCNSIPGICTSPGAKACQHLCNLCIDTGASEPAQQSATEACYDRVGNGLSCDNLPGVCSDQIGTHILCPLHCGTCGSTTTPSPVHTTHPHTTHPPQAATSTRATVPVCQDKVLDGQCAVMIQAGVCQDHMGHALCPMSCGFCDADAPLLVGR